MKEKEHSARAEKESLPAIVLAAFPYFGSLPALHAQQIPLNFVYTGSGTLAVFIDDRIVRESTKSVFVDQLYR